MKKNIALIGNQNSGKTTLYNHLTGSNQHVGNFPGVTVEKKSGELKGNKNFEIVDLPGIYSLSPYSAEEVVTRDYLLSKEVSGVINIIDATNIERNLYLTLQLLELKIPMVVALNMMDEVVSCGNSIDIDELQERLGVPIIPISASKKQGITNLIDKLQNTVIKENRPKIIDFCSGEVHRAIHSISHVIEPNAIEKEIPVRFAATKLVEGDIPLLNKLELTQNEQDIIEHICKEMEDELKTDREAAMADMRYIFIEKVCLVAVHKICDTNEQKRTLKIDKWLTHKYLGIPIFLGVMGLIFYLTFGVLGGTLSELFENLIAKGIDLVDRGLTFLDINPAIQSLVVDGVFVGIGSVLSFLPTILILFFFLSILEDTGYMARVAFVMDRALRRIGLSGKSFVPMLLGFGCSVPAIMATRTLASERDRKLTIILIPFMSCSAKVPIYALFTAAFFESYQALVMLGLYLTGMIVAILAALLLKSTVFKGDSTPFLLELPAYRFPSPKSVYMHIYDKAKDFIKRAFTIIFVATIVIWFFQSFDFRLNLVSDSKDSMLAAIGSLIAPIFTPLGFGDWKSSTALITGLSAKEAVVSTFAVLTGAGEGSGLLTSLQEMFTPYQAISFLLFTLLYMPCVATLAAVKREYNSLSKAGLVMAFQTVVAYFVSFSFYSIVRLLGFS